MIFGMKKFIDQAGETGWDLKGRGVIVSARGFENTVGSPSVCLLYTSDAAANREV